MKFDIIRQESYSRGELLLRSIFGNIYIVIPHAFILYFLGIWSGIINIIAFWTILFTGKYPQGMFDYQVKMMRWNARLSASLMNMVDGYPEIGLEKSHPNVIVEIPYPENLSQGTLLLKVIFGMIYVAIPHMFVLYFRMIASAFCSFVAWWSILFTGQYPEGMFKFNVGTQRWSMRISLYMAYLMSDVYPPFNGRSDEEQA